MVSPGERIRARREELGISQAQAPRELDVARTAYRLWEMEAAKPAPDRWRLLSRWLGISVATMLLAEELIDEEEAVSARDVTDRSAEKGEDWDAGSEARSGDFFQQERSAIQHAEAMGSISEAEATRLTDTLARIQDASATGSTSGWRAGSMRKELTRDDAAPGLARAAVAVVAAGVPDVLMEEAILMTSELVTNAVQHATGGDLLTLEASLRPDVLRVSVADGGSGRIRPRLRDEDRGWGLAIVAELASRWGAGRVGREGGSNVAWFELDLPAPGA